MACRLPTVFRITQRRAAAQHRTAYETRGQRSLLSVATDRITGRSKLLTGQGHPALSAY